MATSGSVEIFINATRKIGKWLLWLFIGAIAILLLFVAWMEWKKYSDNKPYKVTKYAEVTLGDAQKEIVYILGPPPNFISPTRSADNIGPEIQPSYNDSIEWLYPDETKRIDLGFDAPRGQVFSIACYSEGYFNCPTLFGIHDGSSEDEVLSHLGKPSTEEVDGVTKTIRYPQYNLTLYLTKRKVYMLKVSQDAI